MKTKLSIVSLILSFFLLHFIFSCCTAEKTESLVIAVSKERLSEIHKYGEWLAFQQIPLRTIDLSKVKLENIIDSLKICDGLLLTGGADIYPGHYGKENDTSRCGSFDHERDTYEMKAFQVAKSLNMPILGICRGLQIINIIEGGSLTIDLPTDKGSGELHRIGDEDWATHQVSFTKGSLLSNLVATQEVLVASNHHQGIDVLAGSLQPAATSDDLLIEAIEWNKNSMHPFLLAVQWHPEWMDRSDELSGKIAKYFLLEATKFRDQKTKKEGE
ncbi:MAG: hypothetical protein CVT92_17030 [Bacteroidetes bacterium HGW-Bacteroidetes-1]|jgi:putative glutamine amidotransferase|nr:MAG: hypothetical protein CVT92_17030 [Bacteroidetes bacterium HGW-Bacteroidetes-1]